MTDKLTALRAKIVKANPAIRWKICHHGEQADCEHSWQYQDVRLADVLLAILNGPPDKQASDSAIFRLVQGGDWLLYRDSLDEQPPQTIEFLFSLFCE